MSDFETTVPVTDTPVAAFGPVAEPSPIAAKGRKATASATTNADAVAEFCAEFGKSEKHAAYMRSQLPKKADDIEGFLNEFAPNKYRRGVMKNRLEELVKE